jgi:hypothetical protein
MAKDENTVAQMVAVMKAEEVIINHFKKIVMSENTRDKQPDKDRGERKADLGMKGNVTHQEGSSDIGSSSTMDEKSSGMGRRDKGTGLASKDGVTGSDYDGQVTE